MLLLPVKDIVATCKECRDSPVYRGIWGMYMHETQDEEEGAVTDTSRRRKRVRVKPPHYCPRALPRPKSLNRRSPRRAHMNSSKGLERRRAGWSKGSSRPERDIRHRLGKENRRGRGKGSPTSTKTIIFFILNGLLGFHWRLPVAHNLATAAFDAISVGTVCFAGARRGFVG